MRIISTYIIAIVCTLSVAVDMYAQQTIVYDLYVNDTLVNYTGKSRKALAINGHSGYPCT